jgi:hypothetical protein
MGWQANIEYFEDYVIKTPKTESEIRETITRYLNSIGKIEELDKRVKDMQMGWIEGIRIISKSKIPPKMLGNLEFLKNGKIKQEKVIALEEAWNELVKDGKIKEMKNLVDKTLKFIMKLWKYKIHEKTGKIGYEFGLMGEDIILIDFGEICQNKNIAKKQIIKRYWEKSINKHCLKEVANYFNKKAIKVLTIENLNKNWNTKKNTKK